MLYTTVSYILYTVQKASVILKWVLSDTYDERFTLGILFVLEKSYHINLENDYFKVREKIDAAFCAILGFNAARLIWRMDSFALGEETAYVSKM